MDSSHVSKKSSTFSTDILDNFHVYADNYNRSHRDAAKQCKEDGYTLAMPKTPEQQQEMVNQIRSVTQGKKWRLWIGFTGSENGGFTWADGESVTWTNWWTGSGGQPNSGSKSQCGEIVTSASWTWNDNECHNANHFVCQEVSSVLPSLSVAAPKSTPAASKCLCTLRLGNTLVWYRKNNSELIPISFLLTVRDILYNCV